MGGFIVIVYGSFQVCFIESLYLIKGYDLFLAAVIEVGVRSTGDKEKLLVCGIFAVLDHSCIGILAKVAGMCFITMDN